VVVTLEKTKEYLRVESAGEDALITGLIETAEDIVAGVLRFSLSEIETIPGPIEQAVIYIAACLYENRDTLDMPKVLRTAIGLLAPYRKDGW
jgi:tartrate dehydratase beta subunit/fumarate hydratase class I family protein